MLQSVDVGELTLESYRGTAPDEQLDELRRRTAGLRGLRVLHLNATAYGGGVSELLGSIVPLLRDLGVQADWKTITGDQRFFEITKRIHNALQGAPLGLTEEEAAFYLATSDTNARGLDGEYDLIVVHDPQPAAVRRIHGQGSWSSTTRRSSPWSSFGRRTSRWSGSRPSRPRSTLSVPSTSRSPRAWPARS